MQDLTQLAAAPSLLSHLVTISQQVGVFVGAVVVAAMGVE